MLSGGLHPSETGVQIGLEIVQIFETDVQAERRPLRPPFREAARRLERRDEALEPSL
jgi:hypothetical protein